MYDRVAMARYRDEQDEAGDLRDWEDPDESDMDDEEDDDLDLVACPYCRKMIWEEAEHCHYCGNDLSLEAVPRRRLPLWIVLGIVLLALILLVFVTRG
jgi:hypothetical protein